MKHFVLRMTVVGLVLSALAVVGAAAPAGAAVPCAITAQLSATPPGDAAWNPGVSANGSIVFFLSDANTGGQNPGGQNELWRKVGTSAPTVLTSNPADIEIERPDVSANGKRAVFASTADLTGDNADGNEELFLWDLDANPHLQQLTDTSGGSNERPRISASGNRVVFSSTLDWEDNPEGNDEVFLYDLTSETTVQISDNLDDDGAKAVKPDISGDGNVVVYESEQDTLGQNEDGNLEIFRYSIPGDSLTQITDTEPGPGQDSWQGSYVPRADGDGSTVLFESEVAHGSVNTNLEFEAMRWDNGTVTTVTDAGETSGPTVSADGTRVLFSSEDNLVGQNADGNLELFIKHGTTIRQLTRTTGGENDDARISRNGNHIVFGSDRNVRNSNADGNYEVYLATCAPVLKCDGQVVTVVVGQNNPTPGNDVIYGSPRGEFVEAGAGNDRYCANAGNDSFAGEGGNDRFFGGLGNDNAAAGDAGNDTLFGEEGNDTLYGDAGTDSLLGGPGNDFLHGGDGTADFCDGDQGTDQAIRCERMFEIP